MIAHSANSAAAASNSMEETKLSTEELSKNYEQWMKIAADNKINTNNSWNVQLIDYFHDVSLMKEGGSINFQKASCTLDGCVKIYTSRVDSVASETSRLLSGLADNKHGKRNNDDEDDGEDEDGNEIAGKNKSKKTRPSGNTIEKSEQALNVKKFDLEFSVDPLFRKTCADFDEGGASGLLLNHLHVYGGGRIVFDASDVDVAAKVQPVNQQELDELNGTVDMSQLLQTAYGPVIPNLEDLVICPTLRGFSFSSASRLLESWRTGKEITEAEELEDAPPPELDFSSDHENDVVAFEFEQNYFLNDQMVGFDEDENIDDAAVAPVSADALTGQMAAMKIEDNNNSSNLEARKRQQLLVSLDNNDTEQNIYSYFDAATLKNWAGPQHWKVQRPRNQTQQQQKTTKAPRQQFTIDFSDCNELIDSKQLFAKDTRKTTLMSSRSIKNADANAAKLLLPRDLHYTLQDLTQLFMKPSMRVSLRAAPQSSVINKIVFDGPQFRDDQQLKHGDGNDPDSGDDNEFDDDDDDGGPIDDYAGGGVEDLPFDNNNFPHGFSTQLAQHSQMNPTQLTNESQLPSVKIVKSEAIHYEKRAKRVDVRKLKDNIWRELSNDSAATAPGSHRLSQIISHVKQMYPVERAQDITPSFYFICLLHLANEKTLKIENSADLSDLTVQQDEAVCF